MRQFRGNDIAVIFQDPMTSLNPYISIGEQLIEPLIYHPDKTRTQSRKQARLQAIELLDEVGLLIPKLALTAIPMSSLGVCANG